MARIRRRGTRFESWRNDEVQQLGAGGAGLRVFLFILVQLPRAPDAERFSARIMRTSMNHDWLIWAPCSIMIAVLLYLLSFGPYLKFSFSGKPTAFYSPAMEFMQVHCLGEPTVATWAGGA